MKAQSKTSGFSVHSLSWPPFRAVQVWAPPAGPGPKHEVLLLLHGNQADSTRLGLLELRNQPGFGDRILIVPALAGPGYDWGTPATTRALASLVDEVVRSFPADAGQVFVMGYSAGASRVLPVALAMHEPVAGIIALAGDIGRPLRSSTSSTATIARTPVLLICNSGDVGPNASCALDARNHDLLTARGARDIEMRRLEASHAIEFPKLAPVVDEWLRRRHRGPMRATVSR
ncbi:MAG TPA: hypothetical protein VK989_21030 [Polyangia bacterium]|nr:hypothetical protein [Polyangia bacterium]